SERRPGYGCGANDASITRRSRARSQLSGGDRMLRATGCMLAPAARVVEGKVRPSSGPVGPAITSALSRSRHSEVGDAGRVIVLPTVVAAPIASVPIPRRVAVTISRGIVI